jgi:hypothetical protein
MAVQVTQETYDAIVAVKDLNQTYVDQCETALVVTEDARVLYQGLVDGMDAVLADLEVVP